MFCLHCGNQLPDGSAFCNKCGQALPQVGTTNAPAPQPSTNWSPTVQAGPFSPPSSQDWPATVRADKPSQPGWQPTVQAGPSSLSGEQLWQQVGQTGPTGQPVRSSWPGIPPLQGSGTQYQSGPVVPQPLREPASAYPSWPAAQNTPSKPQQPPAPAVPPPPPGKFQQWMIRTFQTSLAGNPIFGIVSGGLVALIVGGLASILLIELFQAIAPNFGASNGISGFHQSGQDIMDNVLGLFVPLHSSFRDGMQFFFEMHGATSHAIYTSNSSTFTYSLNPTLSGLLVIPALALVLGGYVAASTDLQNRAKLSLLRGVAIALPYALLMLIIAQQVNGSAPLPTSAQSNDTYTLSFDSASIFIFALLWGAIFGALGATIKLGRGRWRQMVVGFLASLPQRQIVGMLVGGLSALGLGMALSLLTIFGMMAFSAFSTPIFVHNLCFYGQGYANWQYMTGWSIASGPLHAVNLFSYSFGAPITIGYTKDFVNPCFYVYSAAPAGSDHITLSLFGGSPRLPSWTYAFVALPVISLFLGGRVSAAFGRAQNVGQGIIQGALIAVPFTVLMMLLSAYSMLSYSETGPYGSSSATTTLIQTFGVAPFDLLLWALLSGAVLGGLGGFYQASALKGPVHALLRGLILPLKGLGVPGLALFNRLSKRPRAATNTSAQRLFSGAILAAFILAIAAGAVAVCFVELSQSLDYTLNTRLRDIASVVLVAVPGLLLICAGAAALAEEKLPPLQTAQPAIAPPAPLYSGGPVSQYPQSSAPGNPTGAFNQYPQSSAPVNQTGPYNQYPQASGPMYPTGPFNQPIPNPGGPGNPTGPNHQYPNYPGGV